MNCLSNLMIRHAFFFLFFFFLREFTWPIYAWKTPSLLNFLKVIISIICKGIMDILDDLMLINFQMLYAQGVHKSVQGGFMPNLQLTQLDRVEKNQTWHQLARATSQKKLGKKLAFALFKKTFQHFALFPKLIKEIPFF